MVERRRSDRRQEEGKGKKEEDETKGRLLWLMCDKCSQLGEFSRSLEQVIIQELLLARPRPTLYWLTEMHARDGVRFPLNRSANPPLPTHVSWHWHTGIEQLLLNCNISTAQAVCRWREVDIKLREGPKEGHLMAEWKGIRSSKQLTLVLRFRTWWSWKAFPH